MRVGMVLAGWAGVYEYVGLRLGRMIEWQDLAWGCGA